MTPGPTRVPDRVLGAGARPMLHHRSPEFSAELADILRLIRPVFGARGDVLPVHATGRGAMEATICNLFSAGDEIVVCCNGKFGELWARLAASYGLVVHRVARDWSRDIDPLEVEQAFRASRNVRGLAMTYCDTSTGVANDIAATSRIARAHGALVLVDGVSAIGGMPFAFDGWEVDAAVTASQKCLMSSPGLAFVAVSDRAWAASDQARLPRNYWNFGEIRKFTSKSRPETLGTPPIHVVLQVAEALRMIHEEGLDDVFARHELMAARMRDGIAALGLSLQCPSFSRQSATVTAIATPEEISPTVIRDALRSRGILAAAGLGAYEPHAFRLGHMGDIRMADIEMTLSALADVLGR